MYNGLDGPPIYAALWICTLMILVWHHFSLFWFYFLWAFTKMKKTWKLGFESQFFIRDDCLLKIAELFWSIQPQIGHTLLIDVGAASTVNQRSFNWKIPLATCAPLSARPLACEVWMLTAIFFKQNCPLELLQQMLLFLIMKVFHTRKSHLANTAQIQLAISDYFFQDLKMNGVHFNSCVSLTRTRMCTNPNTDADFPKYRKIPFLSTQLIVLLLFIIYPY